VGSMDRQHVSDLQPIYWTARLTIRTLLARSS
jgi:hypothetical protein